MGLLGKIFGEIASPVTDIIGKAVVDKDKARELEYKVKEIVDRADQRFHEELMGQIEVNKVEAAHPSIFVAGWRPFIGWTCGVGIAYHFVLSKFLELVLKSTGWYTGDMPILDSQTLLTLVLGMLGIGAQRSFDKFKGVDTKKIASD